MTNQITVIDIPRCAYHGGASNTEPNPDCPTCAEAVEHQRAKCGSDHEHVLTGFVPTDGSRPFVVASCPFDLGTFLRRDRSSIPTRTIELTKEN